MCYAMLIVTQLNENGIFGIVAVVTLTTDSRCLFQYQHNGPVIETHSLKCFEYKHVFGDSIAEYKPYVNA